MPTQPRPVNLFGGEAARYDQAADAAFAKGTRAGATGDKYVRDTVFLATVLFLVGISVHFTLRGLASE